jgi:hypothetical protein
MTDQERQDINWTSTEAAEWRAFLRTKTGEKLLRGIASEEPELLDGTDVNRTLVRSGEVKHHKVFISFLLSLANDPVDLTQVELADNYPPLEDDTKWNDGQKLNSN